MLYAPIDTATSGDNAIVAADNDATPRKIRVISYVLVAAGAVTATWGSDVGGSFVKLSGAMSLITGTSVYPGFSGLEQNGLWAGHFETGAGKALNLKLGGNVQVSGHLNYILVR